MKLPKCLVNGQHTPGSEWERECLLNPDRAGDRRAVKARRLEAASPAQHAAWAEGAKRFSALRGSSDQGVDSGSPKSPVSGLEIPATSNGDVPVPVEFEN